MSTVLGSGTPRVCALAEDGVHLTPILGAGTQPESAGQDDTHTYTHTNNHEFPT